LNGNTPRASVVIPNWNGLRHLPECMETLAAQSFQDFETILIDNASSDDSVAWMGKNHPEARVIVRPDNGGFSKAVNAGVLAARGEYIALLNNDTAVDVGWLEALVYALDTHSHYDLAASKMILYYEPERLNAAGDIYRLAPMAGANRGFGEPSSRYDEIERVLGACAGAAMYRSTLFHEVGLFDEDFFLMHEDTDFNLRCLIAGKRCLYVPGAQVRHKWRSSIGTEPESKMTRLLRRNEAFVAAKDLPARVLIPELLLWGWRMFRNTIPLRPSKWHLLPGLLRDSLGRFRAEVDGFRRGFAKRQSVWSLQAITTREIVRWLRNGSGPV
jgi:GT2 family glycosyltransferase